MRRACFISVAPVLTALLLYGCAGIEGMLKPAPESDAEIAAAVMPRREREFTRIQRPYNLESLLVPILQYNNLVLSFDYFPQFTWDGDFVFPEYLHKVFRVENSPFRPGEGTVLIAGYEDSETELRIERALLQREKGGEWWQVRQTYFDDTAYYEVFVSDDGEPVRIRYIEPRSGSPHEVEPEGYGEYEGIHESPAGERELLLEEEAAEIAKEWSYAFNEPSIVGEELIEVAAGTFMTVHVRDTYDDEYGTGADYFISPDVPGSIVRIVYSSPGLESYIVELHELTVGNTSTIDISETVEGAGVYRGGGSEGSPPDPVTLTAGESYAGRVGPGGTSYYRVKTERRADIYIEVLDLSRTAELYYYGGDPTFFNWRSSSSGRELSAEEYFVELGTDLFFTVVNPDGAEGKEYTINVREDVFLSPIGIGMRGEIYYRARELKTGDSYAETLDIDGLNYYRTKVKRGRHLRISASGIPAGVELVWFEASGGNPSGVYTYRKDGTCTIEVTDVSPGTVCYFYVVGDTEMTPPGSSFSISIEEYTR